MEPACEPDSRKPLGGLTIAVTRMRDQAGRLSDSLAAAGAGVIEAPTIELRPVEDYTAVDAAIRNLASYHWLVLTSANGVDALFGRLDRLGLVREHLSTVRVAVVGTATASRLAEHGICPDLVPPEAVGESLAHTLADTGLKDKRVLLLAADIARPRLAESIEAAGAHCDSLPLYRTACPDRLPPDFLEHLDGGRIDWITFTSPSSFVNLLTLLGPLRTERLRFVRLASIGPVTTKAIREAGHSVASEADPHDVAGLVSAIIEASTRD